MMNKFWLIICLMFQFTSMAYAVDNALPFVRLMQLNLDKNHLEKVEEIYDDHEDLLSKNIVAIERLAISFERREKFKEAIEIYRKLIINFNQSMHEKILNSPGNKMSDQFYNGNKLPFYYYKLAFLNTQLFVKSHQYTPELDRLKYKKNAEGFIALSRKVKSDEEELKLLEDQLLEKVSTNEKLIYNGSWYASFDLMSWQNRFYLINKTTNAQFNLLSTALGACAGGGRKWQNSIFEFNLEGCLLSGSSTVSSQDTSVTYQQSSVSEFGVIAGPGFYLRNLSENVLLGFQIPFMYQKGDLTVPAGSYKFKNDKIFGGGYFLQSKFKVSNLYIRTRLGKIFPNPASQWSIGVLYDF